MRNGTESDRFREGWAVWVWAMQGVLRRVLVWVWLGGVGCGLGSGLGLGMLRAAESELGVEAKRAKELARIEWLESRAEARRPEEDPGSARMIRLARACFELAEFATRSEERASLAEEGIEAGQRVMRRNPELGEGPYYLAINKGQLARTKTLGALRLVDEMERLFQRALMLNPKVDRWGPDRCLGLLYWEAPGWPASVGHRGKARRHLAAALEGGAGYPENWVCSLEAAMDWGDWGQVRRLDEKYRKREDEMRRELAGKAWEWAWFEWERRLRVVRDKIAERERKRNGP